MNQQIQKSQASALDRVKVALAHGAHAIDSGDVSELIQGLERKLESAENQRDQLLDALERIESTVPGWGDGGGFVFDHYDHEGKYIGSQNVDPTLVVLEMAGVATNAIAAVKGGQ